MGWSPIELLSALSGHPAQYETIYVSVLDVMTGRVTEYRIESDVRSPLVRLLDWQP
jgi:hypothetical protein